MVVSEQTGHSKVIFTKDVCVRVPQATEQAASDRSESLLRSAPGTAAAHIGAAGAR